MSLNNQKWCGAVVTKSCTLVPREGNPAPRYAKFGRKNDYRVGSINSMGLPNNGFRYYMEVAREIDQHKPFFLSMSGMSLKDNLQMLSDVEHHENYRDVTIAGVELNLSCPNLPGKPQIGYDFDAFESTLRDVSELLEHTKLGIKLPPYFDPVHFDQAAEIIRRYRNHISWVTCINSIGNGLVIDPLKEQTLIAPKQGLGGIGGASIKPTALANVWAFHHRLPSEIDIVGCGGVMDGWDVFEHILCGAKAVQIGTLLAEKGPHMFEVLCLQLKKIMEEKGYANLDAFRGQLRVAQ